MIKSLTKIISVDEEKCVNCHKCIAVCPVKFCNDGSKDHVEVNNDLCIGCGQCLEACMHGARKIIDDLDEFIDDSLKGKNIVAIVAPSIAAQYPENYLKINGWLKSIGVSAIFDVSFGAELTVKTYLEYIKNNNPKAVISQPCPAIVTYIQLYQPQLLPYLAPADSPMMHTIKMIKEFYPQYNNHKIAVISPCVAKKREFDEVGLGDYNVTISRMNEYFKNNNINIENYKDVVFDNAPAERAVLFSTPGGLLRTAERELPAIVNKTRKIEGPEVIYTYLDGLNESIEKGINPLLIDCLNCDKGCNGGTGTDSKDIHPDLLEYHIEKRKDEMLKLYKSENKVGEQPSTIKKIRKTIDKYWKDGLYGRSYQNLSGNVNTIIPSEEQYQNILIEMGKTTEDDIKNCASCGYGTCKQMATAIFNGLNRPENCHFYLQKENEKSMAMRKKMYDDLNNEIINITGAVVVIRDNFNQLVAAISNQIELVTETTNSVEAGSEAIGTIAEKLNENAMGTLISLTDEGDSKIKSLNDIMDDISKIAEDMSNMITIIDDISGRTNMLSINAAIQSAHAGEYGKAFSVVAKEIKGLAENTAKNVDNVSRSIKSTNDKVSSAVGLSDESGKTFLQIAEQVKYVNNYLEEVEQSMEELSSSSKSIIVNQEKLKYLSNEILRDSEEVQTSVEHITNSLQQLKDISK